MKAIILAAGMGTRLGSLLPKPLTALKNEKTIMDYQVEKLSKFVGSENIHIVVGYKFYSIIEKFPNLAYVYNNRYTQTNTAKSLLMALEKFENEDILWLNGDVYFDYEILEVLGETDKSACAVDNKKCADEEIKYTLGDRKYIKELSKEVKDPVGEALGINIIRKNDLESFKEELGKVEDKDYFEKALENLTMNNKIELEPVDVNGYFCQEIDFPEDLEAVRIHISQK